MNGTDRVELTEDERATLRGVLHEFKSRVCDDDCSNGIYADVESIVAARVQEYAEKFESLSDRAKTAATELGAKNDRLAAELAAANASTIEAQKDATYNLNRWRAALAERDALQATLDRVTAVANEHWDWKAGRSLHDALRAALTPEGEDRADRVDAEDGGR